jgi:hypothetical protein
MIGAQLAWTVAVTAGSIEFTRRVGSCVEVANSSCASSKAGRRPA